MATACTGAKAVMLGYIEAGRVDISQQAVELGSLPEWLRQEFEADRSQALPDPSPDNPGTRH